MSYKLKRFGLIMVAVLAMSAIIASAAQAQFTANSYPTTATGTSPLGNGRFNTEAGSVECATHRTIHIVEASSTVLSTVFATECRAFGFASATVNMNGCNHVLHSNGEVDLECSGSNKVVITAGACEVQIGTQTGPSSVGLANNGNHIDVQANVGGIAYTVTKDGFLCPFSGTGAKTGATYTENAAVTIKPTSGGTDLTID